ncbi:hypothetical protein [Alishewanella longhuensis]
MSIEEILKKSISENLSLNDFERFSTKEVLRIEDSFNQLSLLIAKRFDDGEMSYEDSDYAMNGVWPIMLDYIMKKGAPLVEPCYEIYCAFDAGEFDHGDGADPVEKYTIPAIKAVLKNA